MPFGSKAQREDFQAMREHGEVPCIKIMTAFEAAHFFDNEYHDAAALISIGDVGSEMPAFVGDAGIPAMRIEFDDTIDADDPDGPTKSDVRSILNFLSGILPTIPEDKCLVVHCNMGMSRSPAVAFLAHSMVVGPGEESEAVRRTLEERNWINPNYLVVLYGDEILERGGALSAKVQ